MMVCSAAKQKAWCVPVLWTVMAAAFAAVGGAVWLLSRLSVEALPVVRGLLVLAFLPALIAISELRAVRREGDDCLVRGVLGVRRVTKPVVDVLSGSNGAKVYLRAGRAQLIVHGGYMSLSRAATEAERLGRCLGVPAQVDAAIGEAAAMQRRSFAIGAKIGVAIFVGAIVVALVLQAWLMRRAL
jgi:hypothetical protein